MPNEVLASGVVQIGIDDSKLIEQIPRSLRTVKDAMAPLRNVFKETFSDQLASASLHSLKLSSTFGEIERKIKSVASAVRDTSKSLSLATQVKLYGVAQGAYNYASDHAGGIGSGIRTGVGIAGAGLAAGTGLTFAAAAAAGTTTLNTLTGSLHNLALSAGGKTQDAVLGLSKKIQQFSRYVEDNVSGGAIGGVAGGLSGAAIGYRFGGIRGAAVGGGLGAAVGMGAVNGIGMGSGALAGAALGFQFGGFAGAGIGAGVGAIGGGIWGLKEQFTDEKEKLASSVLKAGVGKSLKVAEDFEARAAAEKKKFGVGGGREEEAIASRIRDAAALAQTPDFLNKRKDFLTAGLGTGASYVGLADARQQAQLAGFDKGVLEIVNELKEIQNNLKAIEAQGGGIGVGVNPPS